MTIGYGISGIGYPSTALGTYGLPASGAYGSYDNYMPSMMGMNSSVFGANAMMNSMVNPMMNPMMAMYHPQYMTQTQQQIEASQLAHAANMHAGVLGNEVAAHRTTDSALIQKALTNSDIQQGVQNLYEKVVAGDQRGIREEFDKLKSYVYQTYADELGARGDKLNPAISATQLIEIVYSRIVSAQRGGQVSNLRDDIRNRGESALVNGFMQGFRRGHQDQYIDETLNHCFGLSINEKEHKDRVQDLASYVGRGASVAEKAIYGGAVGAATYTIGGGALSLMKKACGKQPLKFTGKALSRWTIIPATAAALLDIWWQMSEPKTA